MKHHLRSLKLAIIFFCSISCPAVKAQLFINEYSASNISTVTDNHNEYEDWVELYNAGTTTVNLQGYHLSDDYSKPGKWIFPNVTINANGFLKIFCSARDEFTGGFVHTNFKLTQTKGDKIILTDAALALIDSTSLRLTQKDNSRGRTTDGAATWSLFPNPSPGSANNNPKTDYDARPQFNKPSAFYPAAITVSITCADPNAVIYYTTDGHTPTSSSTVYSAPVSITANTVLRAIAINAGNPALETSFVESASYFIATTHTVAVISIFGDDIETLLNGSQINPRTGLDYFDKTGVYRASSDGTSNEHGNDSWAYDQRGIDFISHDQYGYNYAIKNKLFSLKNRDEFQRIIIKAAANDNYPFQNGSAHIRDAYVHTLSQLGHLSMDERTYEPCVMYVNGQYWGVYEIREKVDDADFTEYYYKQDEFHVQMLKTWGGTWSEFGGAQSQTDWNTLKSFILGNSMAVQSNYDYVDSLFNVKSLVDYFTLNSFVVCKDWLNWNTQWWRGMDPNGDKKKWRYCLWDEDATFGHYVNYTGVPNTGPSADPCDPNTLNDPGGQGHVPVLNALMDNPGFKEFYINRYVDLVNSTFNCQFMDHVLDSLIALIDPEMNGQCTRWGGNYNTWVTNVQTMKQFIDDRCIDLTNGFINCYDLKGPYDLNVNVSPAATGGVQLNSLYIPTYSWTGKYFGNINLHLTALPAAGYRFDHWTIDLDTLTTSLTDTAVTLTLDTNVHVVAFFKPLTDTILPPMPEPAGEYLIPSAFSPNGDLNNDLYQVYGTNITSMELHIYNRWGQEVFSTTDKNKGWDGTYKGEKLNTDVFAYHIKLLFTNGETVAKKGTITLMR
ncbi:MAG: CotH kinase family protein [Bacteroidia bacterium]